MLAGMFAARIGGAVPTYSGWDPSNKGAQVVLTNSNWDAEPSVDANTHHVRSVASKTSGKFYVEFEIVSGITTDGEHGGVGLVNTAGAVALTSQLGSGTSFGFWSDYGVNGAGVRLGDNLYYFAGKAFNAGEKIGLAIDILADQAKVWCRDADGSYLGGGDPATGSSPTDTLTYGLGGVVYLAAAPWTLTGNKTVIRLLTPPDHAMATPSGFTAGWPN